MLKCIKYIVFISGVLLFGSCSSTQSVTVYSLEPAPVDLSKAIKRIGIINEVHSAHQEEVIESFDALVAATDRQLSKAGKAAAIEGLLNELSKDKRFDTILILKENASLNASRANKNNIPWDVLEELCVSHNLGAIFSLAFYETDTRIINKKSTMEELDLLRTRVVVPAREITLETLIENGWRIYDPFERKVLDEIRFNKEVIAEAKGSDAVEALHAMTDRSDSLQHKSKGSGSAFGMRLKPYTKPIDREIYIKGSENLSLAKQAIEEENWLEAARLWQLDLLSEKPKIRAQACHNMAVLYEIKNDLPKAIEWANKALDHLNDKDHSAYLQALEARRILNSQAEEQLVQLSF